MNGRAFTVPGQPFPAERPRAMARNGKGGKSFVVFLTPDKTLAAEARVHDAYRATHPTAPVLAGEVGLGVVFHRHTRVWADVDNLLKTVMDGLNGVAWKDDRQVSELVVRRVMGVPTDDARTEVTVYPLDPGEWATLEVHEPNELEVSP